MSSVTILTAGDKDNGMGHVMRSLAVVKQLVRLGHKVRVVTPPATPGYERLLDELDKPDSVKYDLIGKTITPREMTVANLNGPNAIVIDIEHGPSHDLLRAVRNSSAKNCEQP